MARRIPPITLDFDGRITQLQRRMEGLESRGNAAAKKIEKAFSRSFKAIGTTIAATLSIRAIGSFASESIKLAREQQKAEAKVEQAVKSTGKAAGFTADQLKRIASERQSLAGIGDEKILNEVTAQLLTFTNITGQNFLRTQDAAMDLATVLDGDLKSASIQLGKALNDPVANLSALSRSGIQFSKEQKAIIKDLAESNHLYDAQTIILDELKKQYGGQAEAQAEADEGLKQMIASVGDAQEKIGSWVLNGIQPAYEGVGDLADAVRDFFQLLSESDMETAIREFDEQKERVNDLSEAIPKLLTRYDDLIGKANKNKKEQEELSRIMNQIANDLPTAVTRWDNYGNALEINRQKVIDLLEVEKARLKFLNKEAIAELKLQKQVAETKAAIIVKELNEGFRNVQFDSPDGKTFWEKLKLGPEDIQKSRDELRSLREDIKGIGAELARLTGEDIAIPTPGRGNKNSAGESGNIGAGSDKKEMADNWIPIGEIKARAAELIPFVMETTEQIGDIGQDTVMRIFDNVEARQQRYHDQELQAISGLGNALDNAFNVNGDKAIGVLNQMLQLAIQIVTTIEAMEAGTMSALAGPIGIIGGVVGFFSSLFGGGRASGGSVYANTPYLVGERGPEMFIPQENGFVLPNNVLNNYQHYSTTVGNKDIRIIKAINAMKDDLGGRLNAYNINTVSAMSNIPPIIIKLDGRAIATVTQKNINKFEREGVNKKEL